jgi:GDP-4-dehydro-6-deoxy-D-mannose reductase
MLCQHVWREAQLPIVLTRSFNHTGPGQDPSYVASGIARQIALIEAKRQPPTLRLGNLEPRRDLSDVRDVVRAYALLMERGAPAEPYNVCAGQAFPIRHLLDLFLSRSDAVIAVEQDPALFRPNDTPLLVGDHQRLAAATGWAPGITLEQTVDDLLRYWRGRIGTTR